MMAEKILVLDDEPDIKDDINDIEKLTLTI